MKEIWRTIKDFPMYEISTFGRVKSLYTNKILKSYKSSKSAKGYYMQVGLYKNHKKHKENIHRLVANTFIPNPNNYPIINHKDENPSNNYVDNLEWCTYKYNCNYGTGVERQKLAKRKYRIPASVTYTIK